jgi:hypothetical protein
VPSRWQHLDITIQNQQRMNATADVFRLVPRSIVTNVLVMGCYIAGFLIVYPAKAGVEADDHHKGEAGEPRAGMSMFIFAAVGMLGALLAA